MINISGPGTTEMFTGAYNKRLEQNRFKELAEQSKNNQEPRQTAKEYLGVTVTISEESKEFMAGIADRKAAQRAAKAAAEQEVSGNVFANTGDFKQQYLVLSENLYNNGFYNNMTDDEVKDMEGLLQQITKGMDSVNGISLITSEQNELSHEAAKMELKSSVNALNYFADKYVPAEMRNSFKSIVQQYESFNSARVDVHKNIDDYRDESLGSMALPSNSNKESYARQEIGRVKHTAEEEKSYNNDVQDMFDQLMQKQKDAASIFDSLKKAFTDHASGNSKNANVIAMLQSRNNPMFNNMAAYWSKLL